MREIVVLCVHAVRDAHTAAAIPKHGEAETLCRKERSVEERERAGLVVSAGKIG